MEHFYTEDLQSGKDDWRQLVSYTANLSRMGWQLFGTNKAWETFAMVAPPAQQKWHF